MLATAICPITADRSRFLPDIVSLFSAQTFDDCELLIVNDGPMLEIERPMLSSKKIRCVQLPGPQRMHGAKLNASLELVDSQIVVTWDSDDWYHPRYVEDQVQFLGGSGKQLVGYESILYWREDDDALFQYVYDGFDGYACGNSQCYFRSYWQGHRFENTRVGADSEFSARARSLGQLASRPANGMTVARAHRSNTYKPEFGSVHFPPADISQFPQEFLEWREAQRAGFRAP